ncbi:hypothetical protein H4Q32_011434 [Labeo rohita]|uniref:Uncharacterized protein n=1 Tax=Labeo rohita TaxID=84645 RepID=A0ABQ8LW88_LABRO|nr:hypothetical protein H4Q32_011434 [Labeo rohita]
MDGLETCMRRNNLKLIRILEVADENIRLEVIRICQAVFPSEKEKRPEFVSVVHHLGKPQQGSNGGRPRDTIIQFSMRTYRDAIWKAAKNSSYLHDNCLQFREDFSKGDCERRMKLCRFKRLERLERCLILSEPEPLYKGKLKLLSPADLKAYAIVCFILI